MLRISEFIVTLKKQHGKMGFNISAICGKDRLNDLENSDFKAVPGKWFYKMGTPYILPKHMEKYSKHVKLCDGRRLSYAEYGSPEGAVIFYFHGFPGSRYEAALAGKTALAHNVRFIGIERPGYGASDPKPDRRLLDWPDDIAEFADKLGIDKFYIIGISGGAPYTAACAWKIPSRIIKAGIISGLGPVADNVKAKSFFGSFQKFWFFNAKYLPWNVRAAAALAGKMIFLNTGTFIDLLEKRASASDKAVLKQSEFRGILLKSCKEAFSKSSLGFYQDLIIYANPWGFELKDIKCKVHVWHGGKDLTVNAGFGRYYKEKIPQCQAEFFPDDGHFSLAANKIDHMFEAMLGKS
jgi:pimeloyl-ACP methyl ester carboxylesterase